MASLIRLKQIESGSELTTAANVGTDFSGAVYEIIDGAGLISSSAQVDLVQASNYDGFVVQLDMTMSSDLEASVISASISQSLVILSQTYVTTASLNTLSSSIATSLSASEAEQSILSGAISTTIANLSSSFDTTIDNLSSSINNRFLGIESITASFESFSSSIDNTILNKMNLVGVISSSTQLDGSTLKGITIAPINSDGYSLIISGALAVVDATNLPDGGFGDNDSTVPAQIYLDGNPTTSSVPPPTDPSTNNEPNSNMIDMGEF